MSTRFRSNEEPGICAADGNPAARCAENNGPIGIAVGLALFVGAIADPGRFFSRMYEENEDSRLGFWAITSTPEGFRGWIAFIGLCFFAIGITMTEIVY